MDKRWHVIITWLDHECPKVLNVEELEDLQHEVERGRDWNLIDKIEIRLIRRA